MRGEYPAIALHLIYEKFVKKDFRDASSWKGNVRQNLSSEEESFWAPYIAVLPSTDESMPRIFFE